jgi:hypothetical protein
MAAALTLFSGPLMPGTTTTTHENRISNPISNSIVCSDAADAENRNAKLVRTDAEKMVPSIDVIP